MVTKTMKYIVCCHITWFSQALKDFFNLNMSSSFYFCNSINKYRIVSSKLSTTVLRFSDESLFN